MPRACLGALLLLVAAMITASPAAEFEFREATIDALQTRMAAGTLTARQLTEAYLARIAELDRSGPALRAILEINPDALSMADSLDAERRAGRMRGPLHGIPLLLKDNIDTADRMQTTAGSLAMVGQKPPRDAHLVTRLREAGAVILGKTNLSEWANYRGRNSSSGWSGRGGQTLNPYALDRSPSGSSSGSAVAVAANLCVAAIGTETDGSIVSPASMCGVVGMKPTVGLVSRAGVIPIAASQDTAGPIARTVRDAALLLAAMAGPDVRDAATQEIPTETLPTLAEKPVPDALKSARIGLVHGPFNFHSRMDRLLEQVAETLRAAGAEVVDPVKIPTLGQFGAAESVVLAYEFKEGLNRYLTEPGRVSPMKSLADVIAFNEAHAPEELTLFGQELLMRAAAVGPLSDEIYVEARALCQRLARTEGLDATFSAHRLDAVVMFTSGPAPLLDPINGEANTGGSSSVAAVAGYPSITVPATDIGGLPVNVTFTGPAWTEAKLLGFAADFEQRTKARKEPVFPRSAGLKGE